MLNLTLESSMQNQIKFISEDGCHPSVWPTVTAWGDEVILRLFERSPKSHLSCEISQLLNVDMESKIF